MSVRYAKLDSYDYTVEEFDYISKIRIKVDSPVDIIISDISGEVIASDNNIYLDGRYYKLIDLDLEDTKIDYRLVLTVEEELI